METRVESAGKQEAKCLSTPPPMTIDPALLMFSPGGSCLGLLKCIGSLIFGLRLWVTFDCVSFCKWVS